MSRHITEKPLTNNYLQYVDTPGIGRRIMLLSREAFIITCGIMEMIEKILEAGNLTKACKEVVKNKGAGGIDKMPIKQMKAYLDTNNVFLQL